MINQVGIDVQSKEIVIHKTTAVGPTEFTDAELIPYEIRNYRVAIPEPLWELSSGGPPGRPKRNKSKLKQQRQSRRRNR